MKKVNVEKDRKKKPIKVQESSINESFEKMLESYTMVPPSPYTLNKRKRKLK